MTTRRSASLAVHDEAKRGKIDAVPRAPLHRGGEVPADRPEFSNWTTPAGLRAQLQRLWERGDLLRAIVDPDANVWPRRLNLKTPGPVDLTERFNVVGPWAAAIARMPVVRLEWREW